MTRPALRDMVLSTLAQESIDEEIAMHDQSGDTHVSGDSALLIEANLVTGDNTGVSSGSPLVSAKPDPWYHRNQWWLAGGLVLFVVAVVLTIVFTTVDLSPASAPTMFPTTEIEGVGAEVEAIVLGSFPLAVSPLADEARLKELKWRQSFWDPFRWQSAHLPTKRALKLRRSTGFRKEDSTIRQRSALFISFRNMF
jgi:hypothetical protein